MKRFSAEDVNFSKVKIRGHEFFFTDCRIDPQTLPKGLCLYEVREADEYCGEPAEISEYILVNFFGTLISKEPIKDFEWDEEWEGRHFLYLKFSDNPEWYETEDGDISETGTIPHYSPLETEWDCDWSQSLTISDQT